METALDIALRALHHPAFRYTEKPYNPARFRVQKSIVVPNLHLGQPLLRTKDQSVMHHI